MPPVVTAAFFIIVLAWLGALTYLFVRLINHYNRIAEGVGKEGLKGLLEEVLKGSVQNKKDIEMLRDYCGKIEQEGNFHIQKVGLHRFNPFKDTGGDQSFILSLVDKNDTGVIISGLYSRSGLRWYAKRVINGKGSEHELSDEEKKALREAGTPR
jgi:hypothetical protein